MRNLSARTLLCLSLSCAALLSSAASLAAPPARSDDDAATGMARERFKEGVGYFDQKQYDKARAAFMQAYALKKHPAVLLNLAQSELRSNYEADAATHFAQYLRESKDATDAERQAAQAGLAAAKVVAAEVSVSIDERGAEVLVDGATIGNSPLPGALYLTPGAHTIEAHKEGRTASVQITAVAGKNPDADLHFAPKAAPKAAPAEATEPVEAPAEPKHGSRKSFFGWLGSSPVGLVGLGLTGVGLGSGVGFALASNHAYSNADAVAAKISSTAAGDNHAPPPLDTRGLCTDPSTWLMNAGYVPSPTSLSDRAGQYANACSKYHDNVHSGDTYKTVSTVSFVVAGVAAVGTIIYYFVDPNAETPAESARTSAPRVSVVPTMGPGERGLSVVGSF